MLVVGIPLVFAAAGLVVVTAVGVVGAIVKLAILLRRSTDILLFFYQQVGNRDGRRSRAARLDCQ